MQNPLCSLFVKSKWELIIDLRLFTTNILEGDEKAIDYIMSYFYMKELLSGKSGSPLQDQSGSVSSSSNVVSNSCKAVCTTISFS